MVTVSVITPTLGRESLADVLRRLLPQLGNGDEALLVGEGSRPRAKEIADSFKSPFIRYWEEGPYFNWGNPQRNSAIKQAKGSHLVFIDDDDSIRLDGIATIKAVAGKYPGRPIMFRMLFKGRPIWRSPKVQCANVSGQMFIAPNVPGRLGTWSSAYGADYDFICSTLALYPEGHAAVVWREEMPIIQGFAGPRPIGPGLV